MDTHIVPQAEPIFLCRHARNVWSLDPTPITREIDLMMEAGVLCTGWSPLHLQRNDEFPLESQVLSDAVHLWSFVSVFSRRACDAMQEHFRYGQLLPITVGGRDFFIYKPLVGCRATN